MPRAEMPGAAMMHCTGCREEIVLKNSEKRLENHSRKGTWHKIGELTEEEKIPYNYPFHVSCALEALEKEEPKSC